MNTPPKTGPTLAVAQTIPIVPKYTPLFRIEKKSSMQITRLSTQQDQAILPHSQFGNLRTLTMRLRSDAGIALGVTTSLATFCVHFFDHHDTISSS